MKVKIKVPGAGLLAGMGILGFLILIAFWVFMLVSTVVGIYLAFSASIILGFIVLFVEPMPVVIGLLYLTMHVDLAAKIMEFLHNLQ